MEGSGTAPATIAVFGSLSQAVAKRVVPREVVSVNNAYP